MRATAGPKGVGLGPKLLGTYLLVAAFAAAVLLYTAEAAAHAFYLRHVEDMVARFGEADARRTRRELERGFHAAFRSAVPVAGAVTLPLALGAALLVSRRIALPVRRLSRASARIAAGRYRERLPDAGRDELGELTRNFNLMAAALEQTEERRVELIGAVAHELKTPLAGIRGYAEGILDGVFPLERASPGIVREVRRLERLVDDLSVLTRAEAGAVPILLAPVALGRAARDACARLEPAFRARGLALTVQEDGAVEVRADEDRLTQVLVNLLSNALRHTSAGGATVRVYERDGFGVLEVADTGEGIAAEDLPHVFERFYRADRSRARDAEDEGVGAGVGLTVSRHLVEAMGGTVRAASGPGGGATLTVRLPLLGAGVPAPTR